MFYLLVNTTMVAQHVSIHKQGPLLYVSCTIDGHHIITFDEIERNAILRGEDIELTVEGILLQGVYVKEFE